MINTIVLDCATLKTSIQRLLLEAEAPSGKSRGWVELAVKGAGDLADRIAQSLQVQRHSALVGPGSGGVEVMTLGQESTLRI